MDIPWTNTRAAVKELAQILTCCNCNKEPVTASGSTNCGHFFCTACSRLNCVKCGSPAQLNKISHDFMVTHLAHYCSIIGDLFQENIWKSRLGEMDISEISLALPETPSTTPNKKQNIPKTKIDKKNHKGETFLHTACIKNQEDRVKSLLAAGANPNTKDNCNWTPLQEAVNYGFTNICKLLLEAHAQPNTPGESNGTALHDATKKNRLEEAKLLLQYGANKDVYDECGKKPIDYCTSSQMRRILTTETKLDQSILDKSIDFNQTLDQSFSNRQRFVVYPSNLEKSQIIQLQKMAAKHKITVVNSYRPNVTHVVVNVNDHNITNLSLDVITALLRGNWLLNSGWIMESNDIPALETYEVHGAPKIGIPKIARQNAEKQNPGLFNKCHFFFVLSSNMSYSIGDLMFTKEKLIKLVQAGDGTVLARSPNPEDIKNLENIPFHVAQDPNHPLYKCTHYIIYEPGSEEPRIKYNMPHIKTLALKWLFECIETFTLVNPYNLGLLTFE